MTRPSPTRQQVKSNGCERIAETHHAIAHILVEVLKHLRFGSVPLEALELPLCNASREVLHDGEDVDEEPPWHDCARDMLNMGMYTFDEVLVLVADTRPAVHGRQNARS